METSTVYFSKDQRTRFDLYVLTEAKSCAFSLSFTLSVTHLFSPSSSSPFFTSVHLLFVSFLAFQLPGFRPQNKFIGGGGMPVEVKRVSGSPSASLSFFIADLVAKPSLP